MLTKFNAAIAAFNDERAGAVIIPVAVVLTAVLMVPAILSAYPVKDQSRFVSKPYPPALSEDITASRGIQLASLGTDIPIIVDRKLDRPIQTAPVTIKTPFGTEVKTRVGMSAVPQELKSFLSKVQSQCGTVTVISAHRPGSRVGGRLSCHHTAQAVDYQIADPACALRAAKGFRGGHSTDYYGVQALSRGMPAHYHASVCRQEMGARFVHRGSSAAIKTARAPAKATKRYAKKRTRYVKASPRRGADNQQWAWRE